MVGIPSGTEENVVQHEARMVRDGGAGGLAGFLAGMPDKKAAALVATQPSDSEPATSRAVKTTVTPPKSMQEGRRRDAADL